MVLFPSKEQRSLPNPNEDMQHTEATQPLQKRDESIHIFPEAEIIVEQKLVQGGRGYQML